ncbi:hypothetical protein NOF04DRAFT_20177 [Fusarium oxysporum II5]|uniref:Uncharacterized protein n=2 Tax=Fusarium oxysporum species complex TaxID=171631 RepID=X0K5K0_FUSO5|nr:uncharacterized protein FOIG_05596 [Fusarium odoratissimum NRRL 54006]EXM04022.1 hypothetical protein FOIG_05596 [Fusarium odoratissimum NRRL 54006]KAH7208995.1 hypothetical protein DER44DRAFT_823631 [Fusarium oxysporum]KAK2131712.1 hypothetical protein NOF04DRAFT_20177 [Fusarium oxysporum II5]TXC10214.1 hypothetical protein FocTR4_00005612 [Fusarium oxysporum f. sp. cubense]
MSREAWGYIFATVLFTVMGGASFFGQIIQTALPELQQTNNAPEDYLEHQPEVFYHGRGKFSAHDRLHRKYGICCDQEWHCISCVNLQAEEVRVLVKMRYNELDRRMKEALTKCEERGVDS